jgi:hypothetical protein
MALTVTHRITKGGMSARAKPQEPEPDLEDLLSKYWALAFEEGKDCDVCNGTEANEILHQIAIQG